MGGANYGVVEGSEFGGVLVCGSAPPISYVMLSERENCGGPQCQMSGILR